MAPRRNNSGGPTTLDIQNLFGLDQQHSSIDSSFDSTLQIDGGSKEVCCVPNGECWRSNSPDNGYILPSDIPDAVRVICNNESCTAGQYMHRKCFEAWEQTVLSYLKSIGRARSWSEKQRQQNLWTKKGYDLVFKACGCKCGRGHLKKDLDWIPPTLSGVYGKIEEDSSKKKKKRNRNNQKPSLAISTSPSSYHHVTNQMGKLTGIDTLLQGIIEQPTTIRGRAGSLSSSNGSSSPPVSSSEQSISPIHCGSASNHISPADSKQQLKTKIEIYSEKVRATSGANGIFSRRLDFSSFNVLPKQRINSYAIKIEDEGNHGNDETRLFILSSLAAQHKSKVACVICEEPMLVFDRYPLVDGTFFLSPKQYTKGCIEVKYEGKIQYLTSVCMECLEGVSYDRVIRCRFCTTKWEGSSLVLGTMYSYDIFAALPCCGERLKCNSCFKLLLHPHQRLNFFSDYSHPVSCPYCSTQDVHFVKPLTYCYTKQPVQQFQQWP